MMKSKFIFFSLVLFVFLICIPYLHYKASKSDSQGNSRFPFLHKLERQLILRNHEAVGQKVINRSSYVSGSHSRSILDSLRSREPIITTPSANAIPRCSESFTSQCEVYWYVQFWKHRFQKWDCLPSPLSVTHKFSSSTLPSYSPPPEDLKYLVFEPDRGGWNNIRMAAETAIMFAVITGRVLVLPPSYVMYLLWQNGERQEDTSSFGTFFDMHKLKDHVKVISMEEFLTTVAMKGLLNKSFPEDVQDIKVFARDNNRKLWEYLESACYVEPWQPGKQFIGFNLSKAMGMNLLARNSTTSNLNDNINIDKSSIFGEILPTKRLSNFASHGRTVRPYDATFHSHRAVYFPGDYRNSHRILTHFYSYLYFADPHLERIYKRFVRDRLHYKDEIFCIAGKIIKLIHQDSAREMPQFAQPSKLDMNPVTKGGNTNLGSTYIAYHIRRGDFQYKDVRLPTEMIYGNTIELLPINRTRILYISTDDKNKSSFDIFKQHFQIKFIGDYLERAGYSKDSKNSIGLSKFNQNWVGMIEQIICANAHTFVGTPFSTFTGYISRMRGYYRDGRYSRSFYYTKAQMHQLHQRTDIHGPFWAREFAVAHKNIDDDYI